MAVAFFLLDVEEARVHELVMEAVAVSFLAQLSFQSASMKPAFL
jgi:hypothetical protein